jgi:hypothetical protein
LHRCSLQQCTEKQKLAWFRNLAGTEAFGSVDSACNLTPPKSTDSALDFSLQNTFALRNANDAKQGNACETATLITFAAVEGKPHALLKTVKPKKKRAPDTRPTYEIER